MNTVTFRTMKILALLLALALPATTHAAIMTG